jgi:hypothetical protein
LKTVSENGGNRGKKIFGWGTFWHNLNVHRRKLVIVLAVCLLIGVGVIALWPGESEPKYQGKKLSEWLALQQQRPQEVVNAIRAMGTNALPFLVKQAEYEIPAWRMSLLRAHSRLPTWMRSDWIRAQVFPLELRRRSGQAMIGFHVLGREAYAAIPELSRHLCGQAAKSHATSRLNAASALVAIGGPDALPPLLAAMTNQAMSEDRRMFIVEIMRYFDYQGPELSNAVPVLIDTLQSTNELMSSHAASALGHFHIEPEACVPALSNKALSATSQVRAGSIDALGQFGPAALPALSVISNALFDSDIRIREVATNAASKIAPVEH